MPSYTQAQMKINAANRERITQEVIKDLLGDQQYVDQHDMREVEQEVAVRLRKLY